MLPHTPPPQEPPRLTLIWRRRFVRVLAVAAAGLLVTRSLAGIPPVLRYGSAVVCMVMAVAALWYLLDSIRPWLAAEGDEEAAALRSLAGARAHTGLVWLAAAGWLYMWASEAGRAPLPQVQLDLSEVLVGFFLAGIFLPVAIVAWCEPDRGRTTNPSGLLRTRFSGGDAVAHRIAAGLAALCTALAIFAASPIGIDSAAGRTFLLAALALIVAATFAILWLWIQGERREGRDAGR